MIAKTGSDYLTPGIFDEGRKVRIPLAKYRGGLCFLVWLGMFLIYGLAIDAAAQVAITTPVLISQPTSTRAIAIDSLGFNSEPFALTSPYAAVPDQRTRVMLFAMKLHFQAGEDLSLVTADAEDAAHQHYNLTVEYVGPVPERQWLSAVVLRLNDNLNAVGDVLVRVSYRGSNSNRVRIGIGHLGGGPPDDQGATPTPVKPFAVSGQVRDDNNSGLGGVGLTLTDRTDGSIGTTTTASDGRFSFSATPGDSFTVTPSGTAVFNFNAQNLDAISDDHIIEFSGLRRRYSISGRLTGTGNVGLPGLQVNLSGFQTAATTTDSNGKYFFGGLPAGRDYTLAVPTTPYYTFVSQGFGNLGGNQVADIPGSLRSYTVSGRVQLGPNSGNGLSVMVNGSQALTLITDNDGKYSTSLPAGGNYSISPVLTFWDFSPSSQIVSDLTSDQINRNFDGQQEQFTISGNLVDQEGLGLPGLTVNLSGAEQRTTLTNNNGHYQFTQLYAGDSYTVLPVSTADFKFTEQGIAQLSGNSTLNFTGLRRLLLNGVIRDASGNGVIGITVRLSGTESGKAITTADGSYSLIATATGNYTVTPSIEQEYYSFTPATVQFNNLAGPHTSDFSATFVPVSNPSYVLEFDSSPKTVDYGLFWPEGVNLGHFFWEFWATPGPDAGATYVLSDGYGGAHALLFGVGSFNTSEANRYELLGDIFDGVRFDNYFGSDVGPAIGEWAHLAVGWDGHNIITYYNGVPVGKTPFSGPRRSPGPGGGGGRLLIGGSDHSNFDGRIAEVRGYEDANPREVLPGGVEASFAPQTVFGLGGNLLSYYFRPAPYVADLSHGYNGVAHSGWVRGTTAGILFDCGGCPPPLFVIDPSAPNFVTGAAPPPVNVPPAATPPGNALVFDSFSRANSTYTFGGPGGLGSTESGSAGPQLWQTNQPPANPQPFGILNARAVLLGNSTALAWVPTGSINANIDVRVNRYTGRWGSGIHTGLSFRVSDANNFFFAYTDDVVGDPTKKTVRIGYYLNGQRIDLANGEVLQPNWTTLRAVTTTSGALDIYVDDTLVYSTNNPLLATATGAGLYSNSAGKGLVNRWDNFTVFAAPP